MELKYFTVGVDTFTGRLEKEADMNNKYCNLGEFFNQELEKKSKSDEKLEKSNEIVSDDGKAKYSISTYKQLADEYLTLASTCHDCVIDINSNVEAAINYEGPSPDEICLVSAAR